MRPAPVAKTVLIIDDYEDFVEALATMIRMHGQKPIAAITALDGIRLAKVHCPDVIVLDIGLPGTNGYDVATVLRRSFSLEKTLIVAVTGQCDPFDEKRAVESGFDLHCRKPLANNDIQKILFLDRSVTRCAWKLHRREEKAAADNRVRLIKEIGESYGSDE